MENILIDIGYNLDIDKSLSKDDYIEKIVTLLKPILQHNFQNDLIKQQIRIHKDRINFACVYCNDSVQSSHKKRGNIILEGKHKNYFKCHNCGIFKNIPDFFKDLKIDLELDVINYISNNLGNFNKTSFSNKYDISLLLDVNNIEKFAIDRQEIKTNFGLVEAKGSSIWSWLTKRLQFQEEKFLYNQKENYILILNLTQSGKIIGAQKRLFYGDNKYITWNTSKLYELLKQNIIVPEEIDIISQLFDILKINFNKPVTLFEGPFDSFLYKNGVANLGAHKKFPLDIKLQYFFDDDKDGKKKSIELLNGGNSVFLWDKFKKDLELPVRKKWDLNDVMIFLKKNNIKIPQFDNYFSNDQFDLIDL